MDVENILAKASEHLSVRRAFGSAYEKDGMLIIPVALVAGGGGGDRAPHAPAAVTQPPVPTGRRDRARRAPPASQDSGNPDAGGASAGWCCRQVPMS